MVDNPVFSVQKAMGILDILVFEDPGQRGFRLSVLSERTGIRPNTLHNLLKTLIAEDYVTQYDNGRYGAGVKIERIGVLTAMRERSIPGGLNEIMRQLRDDIRENVLFCVLSGGQWVKNLELTYQGAIQVDAAVFGNCNIYEKASGRVLMAWCSESELGQVLDRWGMPGEYWDGINTPKALKKALQSIRETGYCEMMTVEDTISALGVPVLDMEGRLIGAIGCYAPAFRCGEDRKKFIRDKALTAAAEMRKKME